MITAAQIRTVQACRRKVGLDEPRYRMLLRNVGGVESTRDLDDRTIEDVMAVIEDLAEAQGQHLGPGAARDYWRRKVSERGLFCGERMASKIDRLAANPAQRYELGAMCLRFSHHRTDQVRQLTPRQAWDLIEALKAIIDRESRAK